MDKKTKKVVIIVVIIFALLLVLTGVERWIRHQNAFVYAENLDETAVTVDGKEIRLRELSYYVYNVEATIDKQARLYNAEDPIDYWNTHFNSGTDGWYITEKARDIAVDGCVCDLIYEAMALEQGYKLTSQEQKTAEAAATKCYEGMSKEQIQITGLTPEIITKVETRKALVLKFALEYFDKVDFTGYEGYRETLVSHDGDYYQKEILPQHEVVRNTYITDGLDMGHVTTGY